MPKILVTGSGGQLGNSLRKIAGNSENEFIFLSRQELDITNVREFTSLLDLHKPNYIINAAAYTAVDKAEEEKENAYRINADSVTSMAGLCLQRAIRFIHISTDYVFDGTGHVPYTEKDKTNPLSVYGQSKRKGEEGIENLENVLILRTSWLYSEFSGNFLQTMRRVMNEREEVRVVFDQVGTPTYTGDLALGIHALISEAESKGFHPGVFHFSNEGSGSWYDFAWEIKNFGGYKVKLTPIVTREYPLPAQRPFYSVLNKEKIKKTYGLTIPHWKESFINCIRELK